MAEQAPVALNHCIALPDELDSVTAAAMANPGTSAWAALVTRAGFSAGENVLINGATGRARKLAVQIARYPGARKIIVTGRNPQAVAQAGGDVAICLNDDDTSLREQLAAQFANGIDVVMDYLWGGERRKNTDGCRQSQKRAALCAGRFTFRRRNHPARCLFTFRPDSTDGKWNR